MNEAVAQRATFAQWRFLPGRGSWILFPVAGVVVALGGLWTFAGPALLEAPVQAPARQAIVLGAMLCTAALVIVVVLWALCRRAGWLPARYPGQLAVATAAGSLSASLVGFAAGYWALPPPWGVALPMADFGLGMLLATVVLPAGRWILRWVRLRKVTPSSSRGSRDSTQPAGETEGGADDATPLRANAAGAAGTRGVGLRGLIAGVTLWLGLGGGALLVASLQVRVALDQMHERSQTARVLGKALAARLAGLPRERLAGALHHAHWPAGIVFRLTTRSGAAFPAIVASRREAQPFRVSMRGTHCRTAEGSRPSGARGDCLVLALPFPHQDLRLVAQVAPPPLRGSTGLRLAALLGFLLAVACVLACLVGEDAAQDLRRGGRRLLGLARPGTGASPESPLAQSGDEIGLLFHWLAALRDRLSQDIQQVEARESQSRHQAREQARYLEEVSVAIRSRLAVIRGNVELVVSGSKGHLTRAQREDATVLLESCDQLLGIVQDLLDVSYAEAGQLALHLEPVDVPALVESQVAALRPSAATSSTQLEWSAAEAIPRVRMDPVQIRRVLANLLSNALKFTEGGRVAVAVHQPRLGWVRVSVADTGTGIAPEHLAVIFEQYRQAPQDRARRQRGSGLGLAIVKRLVTLHGGRVGVESRLGAGSVFWFELPVAGPGAVGDPRDGAASEASPDRGPADVAGGGPKEAAQTGAESTGPEQTCSLGPSEACSGTGDPPEGH